MQFLILFIQTVSQFLIGFITQPSLYNQLVLIIFGIDMKMIFNYDANKTNFHNKGFALSLVLKVRFFGTRKWPIQSEMY